MQITKTSLFDADHPFWKIVIGVIVGVFTMLPLILFLYIFHKLGVSNETANILALVCAMLLGILLGSILIENEVTELRKSAFKAGMVFESDQHIEENYAEAIKKTNS